MSSLKVLVIDDSVEFGTGLARLISSMGHSAEICSDPLNATTVIQNEDFHFILIDCFMPTIDGFQLSEDIHKLIESQNNNTKIILMSGILTDKASQKEVLSYEHIEAFIEKPISKKSLQSLFFESFKHSLSPRLYEFFTLRPCSQDFTEKLNSLTHIHGFELAYLLTVMSEQEVSYKIKLTDTFKNSTYTISLSSGLLCGISCSDYNNSLGELLVGMNHLTREDLSSYIKSNEFQNASQPIGQALVNLHLLSPHAIPIALNKQISNRLIEILSLENLEVSFEKSNAKNQNHVVSLNLYDIKKETFHWANKQHSSSIFYKSLEHAISKFIFKKTAGFANPNLNGDLSSHKDLTHLEKLLVATNSNFSKQDLSLIFSHLILGSIEIASETAFSVVIEKKSTLETVQKLKAKLKKDNPYVLFNVSQENSSDQKISKAYQAIAKDLHPDKIKSVLSAHEVQEATEVFSEVTKSFNLIKTADNRKTYESLKKNRATQIKLQCNTNLEVSKDLLNKGEYSKAFELLNQEDMHKNKPNGFGLYFLWAALKSKSPLPKNLNVESQLEQEKKHLINEALYYYIKGLHCLNLGDYEGFEKLIGLCLKTNRQFLPARRELQMARKKLLNQNTKSGGLAAWLGFKKSS